MVMPFFCSPRLVDAHLGMSNGIIIMNTINFVMECKLKWRSLIFIVKKRV
jgi:hypothetical protein